MPKLPTRIIACFLVPCLLVDPVIASAMGSIVRPDHCLFPNCSLPTSPNARQSQDQLQQQALSLSLIGSRRVYLGFPILAAILTTAGCSLATGDSRPSWIVAQGPSPIEVPDQVGLAFIWFMSIGAFQWFARGFRSRWKNKDIFDSNLLPLASAAIFFFPTSFYNFLAHHNYSDDQSFWFTIILLLGGFALSEVVFASRESRLHAYPWARWPIAASVAGLMAWFVATTFHFAPWTQDHLITIGLLFSVIVVGFAVLGLVVAALVRLEGKWPSIISRSKKIMRGMTQRLRRLTSSKAALRRQAMGQWQPSLLRQLQRNSWSSKAQELMLEFLKGRKSLHDTAIEISPEFPGRSKALDTYRVTPYSDTQFVLESETLPADRLAVDRFDAFAADYEQEYQQHLNSLSDPMLDQIWDYMREGPTMVNQRGVSRPLHDLNGVLRALQPFLNERTITNLLVAAKFLPDKTKERHELSRFLDQLAENRSSRWTKSLDTRYIVHKLGKTLPRDRARMVVRSAIDEVVPLDWHYFPVEIPTQFYPEIKGSGFLLNKKGVVTWLEISVQTQGIPTVRDILVEAASIPALAKHEWHLYGNGKRFEDWDELVLPGLKLEMKIVETSTPANPQKSWFSSLWFWQRAEGHDIEKTSAQKVLSRAG